MIESRRTVVVLLLILAVLLLANVILHFSQPAQPEVYLPEQISLVSVRIPDLKWVEIIRDDSTERILQKENGWEWVNGTSINAETADLMVTFLAYLYSEDVVCRNETDFMQYGLEPPIDIAVFETTSGERHTVEFGNITATGRSVYMRLDKTDTVYTISFEAYDIIFNSIHQET